MDEFLIFMNENNKKSEAAKREEKVLEFWRENKTFQKSLKKNSPKGHYVFYDGPPFATGQMHYGHILGSTAKDVIGRYKTMQGFYVPRKWGWDCHGLPIENIVEKELGIAGHREIEKLGIDKFVEYARSKVLQYENEWESGVERIGRWVDFRGGYKTMDNTFIESVWWALSEINKKGLIYEGVRVLAYCARCETPIANSEIAMDNSYKDIADISVYVKFELVDEPGTHLLAWTTTPWTLPGNTAIAINKNFKYVKVKVLGENIILAESTLSTVLKGKEYEVLEKFSGSKLLGMRYKTIFPYYQNSEVANNENIWKVWHADFVTSDQGTGIAHEAPAFGEDDMNLAIANRIPWIIHVDETGKFKDEVSDFKGLKVKPKDTQEDKDAHLRTDIEVLKYLQASGAYFEKEKIIHSYPHCMRCDTPIIYYALPSWFINITKVKSDIEKTGKKMNWVPEHLKNGRYKNTVENAPDWNISRNRYWASPLPIWKCEVCKNKVFVSSGEELRKRTRKSNNKYFVMRHGEAENNAKNIYSSDPNKNHLTKKGRAQVEKAAQVLKKKKITQIYASPFLRTRETAELVAEAIGLPKEKIIYDKRIRELDFGDFSERPTKEYWNFMKGKVWTLDTKIPGGESFQEGKRRLGEFLYDVDVRNSNENILVVSHGLAVELFPAIIEGADKARSLEILNKNINVGTASLHREHEFVPLPHNADYELDYHRPYIDQLALVCDCGHGLDRIPEVLDCWFESGSMPFAQDHYPFDNKSWKKNNFPAGFVAEYIAQTRTWFYYTHVVSSVLFGDAPFKNIVTTGTLRAEDGEKMSKSKKNYPDPWVFIDKYGVDPLRLYLMSSTLMKGEDSNFSERAVQDIASKIIGRIFNVLAFYELYRDKSVEKKSSSESKNLLDVWIMSRFAEVVQSVTKNMDKYDLAEATKPLDLFVDDLSTWYLRRSRDRIREGDKGAKQTLYFLLKNLMKIMAPLAPFTAEDIWQKLKIKGDRESVHLAQWPKAGKVNKKLNTLMAQARDTVSLMLKERQKHNLPIRQVVASVAGPKMPAEYIKLVLEEVNAKQYVVAKNVSIDPVITPALKAEGEYREFMRELQDRRKQLGLSPGDKMPMPILDIYKKYRIPPLLQMHMLRVAAVASLVCDNFKGKVDKKTILTACLLHDMGNIIKFNMDVFPQSFQPEGVEYWQGVKDECVNKYGIQEHKATLKIASEIGVSNEVSKIIDYVDFDHFRKVRDSRDMGPKIAVYADARSAPHGVLSYVERMEDGRRRYQGKESKLSEKERLGLVDAGGEIEKQIFAKCKIKPEDITDETVAPIIEELKNFVIE